MRASEPHRKTDDLTSPTTGLVGEQVVRYLTERKLTLASRTLTPVSVVAVLVEGDAASQRRLGALLRATLRQSDSIGSLSDRFVGFILDDTTETGAVWAAERVRSSLGGLAPEIRPVTSFGVACYPTHAFGPDDLWKTAAQAAVDGRRLGRNRIEVARVVEQLEAGRDR